MPSSASSAIDTPSLLLTTALMLHSVTSAVGLTCYQCTIRPPVDSKQEKRLCSQFDYSAKFAVDCPTSTFCLTKTFKYPLQNGTTVDITVRDCAPQKDMYHVFRDGNWSKEQSVQTDAYSAGCQRTDNSAGLMTNSVEYCYCDSNLCNSGQSKESPAHHADIMTVIFVFNAMKYIRSIR